MRKFERQHPTLTIDRKTLESGLLVVYARKADGKPYAAASGKHLEEILYKLSEACYKLAGLDAMDAQEWADKNTGQVGVPLSRHHIVHRAHGRDDSTGNLVGVSAETHAYQHEKSSLPRKASRAPLTKAPG